MSDRGPDCCEAVLSIHYGKATDTKYQQNSYLNEACHNDNIS